jgi:hypothetical protein
MVNLCCWSQNLGVHRGFNNRLKALFINNNMTIIIDAV